MVLVDTSNMDVSMVSLILRGSHHILNFSLGNLALSRAIGDFEFKKNYSLTPEKQIITSDPDVSIHQISEEDEFFVLACDGSHLHCLHSYMNSLYLLCHRYLGLPNLAAGS